MKLQLLNAPQQVLLQRMEELLEELIAIIEIAAHAGFVDRIWLMVKIYELRLQLEEIKGESGNE